MVVKKYFGLDNNGQTMNLHEIGSDLGISREMVRQIKEKSLRILRRNMMKMGLKDLPF